MQKLREQWIGRHKRCIVNVYFFRIKSQLLSTKFTVLAGTPFYCLSVVWKSSAVFSAPEYACMYTLRLSHSAAMSMCHNIKKVEAPEPAAGRQTNATSHCKKTKKKRGSMTTQAYLHRCVPFVLYTDTHFTRKYAASSFQCQQLTRFFTDTLCASKQLELEGNEHQCNVLPEHKTSWPWLPSQSSPTGYWLRKNASHSIALSERRE